MFFIVNLLPTNIFWLLIDFFNKSAYIKYMKIIIPKGIKAGFANDDFTGVTVFISEKGCIGGVDVRGNAPATRETDLLHPEKAVQKINAVFLSGGSAFGLNSACGIMDFLKEKEIGFCLGKKHIPIVCGACLYDLNTEEYHYPDAKMGYEACENAFNNNFALGQNGAGKGATVGKIRGLKHATKSGIGGATIKIAGVTVTAIVAVNALGDVIEPFSDKILAGAKAKDGSFINTEKCITENKLIKLITGTNTTIGCILTNAKLTKLEANKLSSAAHDGYARVIRPVHTDYDGDAIFTMATGKIPVANFTLLQTGAVRAIEDAVINAVSNVKNLEIIFDQTEDEIFED